MGTAFQAFRQGFLKGLIATWRYGYFAPLIALRLTLTRKGSYFRHLKALYRLSFGHFDLKAIRTAQRNRRYPDKKTIRS